MIPRPGLIAAIGLGAWGVALGLLLLYVNAFSETDRGGGGLVKAGMIFAIVVGSLALVALAGAATRLARERQR